MNDFLKIVLSLSVSGSILALILLAGKPFLKNRISKAFSYYIWLLVLLRLVVPFAAPINVMDAMLHFEQSSVSNVLPEQAGTPAESNADQTAAASNTQIKSSQEEQGNEADSTQTSVKTQQAFDRWNLIQSILLWLWLAGAAVSIGWFLIAYIVFSRRLRHSCTTPHGDDLAVFESLRGRMRVRLFCCGDVMTPMSIGILRPVILLPEHAYVRSGMSDELKNILRHELTHCRRRDVLYKWLVVAVTSLHWFNPLMILIRREIGRACELSCDEAVIRDMSENERQLYGNTLLTFSAGGKLPAGILATTLCEGKEQLKERLIMIKHYKKKSVYAIVLSFVLMLLIAGSALALGVVNKSSNKTVSKNSVSSEHDHEEQTTHSDAQSSADSDLVATISLSGIEPYEAPGVEITTADSSDIASVIVSYVCDSGTEVIFYRAQNGDIYGAYIMMDGDMVVRFTQGYWADNNWGYQNGYDIQPYNNVFGHDGFYIVCPRGAAYDAYDYYYFDADGTLKVLIQCSNYVVENDMNGDGQKELLYFYHGYPNDGDAGSTFYCFERDGQINIRALDVLLIQEFPDIDYPGHCFIDADNSSVLYFTYRLIGEEDYNHKYELRFTEDSLMVYEQPSDVWLVQREDYEVGLRNQGDQTEILLRRDGAVTVLGSVPSNSDSSMQYSLRPFDAIPELSGFVLENLTSYGWGCCWYYAVRDDSAVCFAQSFGVDMTDIAEDLDGDGQSELICNVTYNADGVTDVFVYRMKNGIPQVADVKDAMLNIPENKHLACLASAAYDVNTGSVTLEYQIEGEDGWRVETAPIDYDRLQFEDFTATW